MLVIFYASSSHASDEYGEQVPAAERNGPLLILKNNNSLNK
jgi:hypothetical protein